MKKLAFAFFTVIVAPVVMAQGKFVFEDFTAADTFEGQYIGSDFNTAAYWGTVADPGTFQLLPASQTTYSGTTGGDPGVDGAGLYSAGVVEVPGQTGTIYVQQRIWNNTLQASGEGSVFPIALATGAAPPPTIPSEAIDVKGVPEPTSFALAGLGAAALIIFRRRR